MIRRTFLGLIGLIPFLGKRVTVESTLKCVPVGLETDGSIKPIEELSYRPDGTNWGLHK